MVGKRHLRTAQQSRRGIDKNDTDNVCSQLELYSIPEALCDEIAAAADHHIVNNESNSGVTISHPAEEV